MRSQPPSFPLHLILLFLLCTIRVHSASPPLQHVLSTDSAIGPQPDRPPSNPAPAHAVFLSALRRRITHRPSVLLRISTFRRNQKAHAATSVLRSRITPRRPAAEHPALALLRSPKAPLLRAIPSKVLSHISAARSPSSPFRVSRQDASPLGLSGEECQVNQDCLPPRICTSTVSGLCRGPADPCLCFPEDGLTSCTSSSECPEGELCASFDEVQSSFCLSAQVVANVPGIDPADDGSTPEPPALVPTTPEPTTSPAPVASVPPGGGLTGDVCSSDSDCRSERFCSTDAGEPCAGTSVCFCVLTDGLLQSCTSSEECVPGEVCAIFEGDELSFCLSAQLVELGDEISEVGMESSPAPPGGLTGDFCSGDLDCQGDRSCDCTLTSSCVCVPPVPAKCTESDQCVEGEVCVFVQDFDITTCVSKDAAREFDLPNVSPEVESSAEGNSATGLTGDVCVDSFDCMGDRLCQGTACSTSEICFCLPLEEQRCTSSDECVMGEVCANINGFVAPICISENFLFEFGGTEIEIEPSSAPGAGLTGDDCGSILDCNGSRSCLTRTGEACTDTEQCICAPTEVIVCTSTADCEEGEICAVTSPGSANGICLSKDVVKNVPALDEIV